MQTIEFSSLSFARNSPTIYNTPLDLSMAVVAQLVEQLIRNQ